MKTTAKHFEYFRERCIYWADKFGLDDWVIRCFHDTVTINQAAATTLRYYERCTADITLAKEITAVNTLSQWQIDAMTKHEAVHVMVGNFAELAASRFVTQDELFKAEEALVVKLCKLL